MFCELTNFVQARGHYKFILVFLVDPGHLLKDVFYNMKGSGFTLLYKILNACEMLMIYGPIFTI